MGDDAERVAAGLQPFKDRLPEYKPEITDMIAMLYSISATLHSLDKLKYRNLQHFDQVRWDVTLVMSSLKHTLDEISSALAQLDGRRTHGASSFSLPSHERVWQDLCSLFAQQYRFPLSKLLRTYKMFLTEIQEVLQSGRADYALMADMRRDLNALLSEQDRQVAARLANLSLDRMQPATTRPSHYLGPDSGGPNGRGRDPSRRRSYERARSGIRRPISPSPARGVPPQAPGVPGSPTSTSTATHSNLSSAILNDHWARNIFADDVTQTRIAANGESSKCLGDEADDLRAWLDKEGFDEVAYLSPEDGSNLSVYFFVRERDSRARVVCRVRHRGRSSYYCLPLNLLEVTREGSSLQLCRRRRSGTELVPWLILKFRTIERMVTFFCTFLALRSQDAHRPVENLYDYELEDEEELFSGLIVDDDYVHALRIYQDRLSGAVRLQASIHEGEMKRAPVWTAFITHHLNSRTWMRLIAPSTVILSELRRKIFTSQYNPPRTSRGDAVLKFSTRLDADQFVEVIHDLARVRY
ncbi:hypothetical protein VTN31DRAFT_5453 [Thermomyces dupontii]|uniref:uncharacterized protein n=1 Tax=Talaromyces thermophilus TaxID=28565 RepID=UPI003743C721